MLLSEALKLFYDSKYGVISPASLSWYQARLAPLLVFLGDMEVEVITITDLRRWRTSLVDRESRWANHPHRAEQPGGLSPATLHAHVRAARTFFKWLYEEEVLPHNPARRLKLPPLPTGEPKKDISHTDALLIINAARYDPRDYALLRFLASTGCRVSGVAELLISNLRLTPDARGRYRATVWEKGRGGKKKCRTVYLGAETAQALQAYLEIRPDPDIDTDRVFLTHQAGRPPRPLQSEGIYRMIQRYAQRLGIKGRWNPHAWRHAFAHGLLDGGADISVVSQLMGHTDIGVTVAFYGQRADSKLADEHARHNWLDRAEQGK